MNWDKAQRDRALNHIVTEASTLWERLGGAYVALNDPAGAALAEARLERWRERSARGDAALFAKRLSWLGVRAESVREKLGAMRLDELPSWSQVFAQAMEMASQAEKTASASAHPFADLLSPFASAGLVRLAPACRSVFTPPILKCLADDLVQQLSDIAAPTFYLSFSVFRSTPAAAAHRDDSGTSIYRAFSANMLAGGLWDFFTEYPALARLLAITVELWARNVSELAHSLEADLPDIRQVFAGGESIGACLTVKPSLSDRHHGGRTVALLEFESGLRLVYKPRDLGIERAWFALLADLNQHGGDFQCLKVLAREGHGWVEAISHTPCRDEKEAKAFYYRAGQLLGVLYALEAYDCFCENIVACGGYPVLIDMETLMHQVLNRSAALAAPEQIADEMLSESVFRVGFLPSWEVGPNGICFDMSGLGARPGQLTPYVQRRWHDVNADAMSLDSEPVCVETATHLPHLHGAPLTAATYAEEIVAGFRHIYELLMAQRERLAARGGLLEQFGRQEIRVVFHATRIYSLLLKRLYAPSYMRNGVERSIQIDFFSRLYLESQAKSRFWPILEVELDALECQNIPRLAVPADRCDLTLPTGKVIERAFDESALDRVRQRFSLLSRDDLQLQSSFIRASLRLSATSARHEPAFEQSDDAWRDALPLATEELVKEAAAIAELIERYAIYSADGGATWIAPQLLPRANYYAMRALRTDLYNGLAGVALFFAALNRVSGTGRRTALAALAPLRKFLSVADAPLMLREGYSLGAGTGIGSFIYALTRCAALLNEPMLLGEALEATDKVSPEWIAADQAFDVMEGAAGLALGLLALYEATGERAVIDKAVRCGDHLCDRREPATVGAAWRTGYGKFMTGFSHGNAGIALALLRLGNASGEPRFRAAAEEAIAFEDSVFDAGEGNWPDFRYAGERWPVFSQTWCHGAPGIGLARLSGLRLFDSPEVRRDIDAALRAVAADAIGEKDGLCCGNLGRADALLMAAVVNDDGRMQRRAVKLASVVVERARQSGGYRLSSRPGQDFFDPSFFQGLSGIGYQLLRIAHPHRLPCVLVWE